MASNRWVWRVVRVVCLTTWAFVMVVVGLLAMLDWPARFSSVAPFLLAAGIVLACAGQFVFAVTAGGLCPQANPRLTGMMELLPWLVAPMALLGVLR